MDNGLKQITGETKKGECEKVGMKKNEKERNEGRERAKGWRDEGRDNKKGEEIERKGYT